MKLLNILINKYSNILIFTLIICVYAPLDIFYKNYQILLFDSSIFNIIIFSSLVIFLILLAFLLILKKIHSIIFFFNSYFILILIASDFIGNNKSLYTLIILDIIILLISYCGLKFFKKTLTIFFFFLFCSMSVNFILNTWETYKKTKNLFIVNDNLNYGKSKNDISMNNVYHIVLDAFQYDTFVKLVEKKKIFIPDEFLILENFFSEFNSTNLSMGVLLDQNNKSKIDYNDSKLLKDLYNNDINIHLYTKNEPGSKYALVHRNTHDYKTISNKTENYFNTIILLFDYTFLNLSPTTLKKYLEKYRFEPKMGLYGFSISNWFKKKIPRVPDEQRNKPSIVDWPYWSVKVFNQLIKDEAQRSNKNNYVFAHLIIPHGPYVLDNKGNFYKSDSIKLDLMQRYENQAEYSIKLMNLFFKELKKNKRYNNSLIIIHSDHGYFFSKKDILNDTYTKPISSTNFGPLEFNKITNIDEFINSWGKGVLLVKPPKNKIINLNRKDYFQLRHVKNIIKDNFSIKKKNLSNDILHYISNDENNITDYNLFRLNKYSKKWEYIENVKKDLLKIEDNFYVK